MNTQAPTLITLEDSSIWKMACEIAEHLYGQLHELPEEERWDTARKIRSSANDLMFYAAQAVGGASPSGKEYEWGNLRRTISALKTMYRFAGRQKFLELEPSVMVKIDELIKLIDTETAAAYKASEAHNSKELASWREKYKLWKETSR